MKRRLSPRQLAAVTKNIEKANATGANIRRNLRGPEPVRARKANVQGALREVFDNEMRLYRQIVKYQAQTPLLDRKGRLKDLLRQRRALVKDLQGIGGLLGLGGESEEPFDVAAILAAMPNPKPQRRREKPESETQTRGVSRYRDSEERPGAEVSEREPTRDRDTTREPEREPAAREEEAARVQPPAPTPPVKNSEDRPQHWAWSGQDPRARGRAPWDVS